jgi:hypothetical protein
MIDDREVRQSLGLNEEFSVAIDFSTIASSERLDVANRVKDITSQSVYELILRLGQDPLTFDEAAFVVPEDDSDPEYTLKRDLKSSIDKLAWINSFISSL